MPTTKTARKKPTRKKTNSKKVNTKKNTTKKIKLSKNNSFSKKIALVFAAVFAVIGVYTLLQSSAATPNDYNGFTVDSIVYDMYGAPHRTDGRYKDGVQIGAAPWAAHELLPVKLPNFFDWYHGAIFGANFPLTNKYVSAWGQVFAGEPGAVNYNARVQVDEHSLWILHADNIWREVKPAASRNLEGDFWTDRFRSLGAPSSDRGIRSEGGDKNGGHSFRLTPMGSNSDYATFHWWWSGYYPREAVPNDAKGVWQGAKMRLIHDTDTSVDLSQVRFIASIGSDRYDAATHSAGSGGIISGMMQPRMKRLTPQWRYFSGTTLNESQLRANPPPIVSTASSPAPAPAPAPAPNPTPTPTPTPTPSRDPGSTVVFTDCDAPASSENLAKGQPVAVSSTQNNSQLTGCKAVDGSYEFADSNTNDSRWASEGIDPQYLTVDLGSSRNVRQVKINWEFASAKAYEVQISNDNNTWTKLASESNNQPGSTATNPTAGLRTYNVNANGRYVRVYSTERATQWKYSIVELEVYSSSPQAATPVSPAPAVTPISQTPVISSPSDKGSVTANPTSGSSSSGASEATVTGEIAIKPKVQDKPVASVALKINDKQVFKASGADVDLDNVKYDTTGLEDGDYSLSIETTYEDGEVETSIVGVTVKNDLNAYQRLRNKVYSALGGSISPRTMDRITIATTVTTTAGVLGFLVYRFGLQQYISRIIFMRRMRG